MLKQIITTQYTYLGSEPKKGLGMYVLAGIVVIGTIGMLAYSVWSMI